MKVLQKDAGSVEGGALPGSGLPAATRGAFVLFPEAERDSPHGLVAQPASNRAPAETRSDDRFW